MCAQFESEKKVYLIGAGKHSKVVEAMAIKNGYIIQGYLDDIAESYDLKNRIVGKISDIKRVSSECNAIFLLGVGDNQLRKKIMSEFDVEFLTIISTNATIANEVVVGNGTVILDFAYIGLNSVIGDGVIVNTYSVIEHDSIIGDYSHIAPRVITGGSVKIGRSCFIGLGAIIRNNISICDNAIIGMGSVVTKSIIRCGIYFGNPAKYSKEDN